MRHRAPIRVEVFVFSHWSKKMYQSSIYGLFPKSTQK
jgi:hypothetical protein